MSRPWLKSWVCSLDKPKVMALPGDLFKVWQVFQWIAERADLGDGALPPLDECAFAMHKDKAWLQPFVTELVKRQLLDIREDGYAMHDWPDWQSRKPSDEPERIRERVTKYRAKDVTPSNALPVDETPAIPDVTPRNALPESVTPCNARNAISRTKSEIENREEEEEIRTEREQKRACADAPATPPAVSPKQNRKKPKIPIPEPFVVTEVMFAWADEMGFTDAFVRDATEYFVRWAKSHDHRYADWEMVWQNVLDGRWKERHGGKIVPIRSAS